MRTYVIADIGACHDGDPIAALRAVDVAAACGVDMIKYQWTSDPDRMADRRGRAREDGYADVYRRYLAMPRAWHVALAARCHRAGIAYGCTVFLPEDVAVVAPVVAKFKVASFEAEDEALLDACAAFSDDRDVIVSLGMGANRSVSIKRLGVLRLVHLRCVSAYPAPYDALRLRVLWPDYMVRGGLSDHTRPELVWTGALAVASGAEVVEAHLKLDETDPANPDAPHAMTPAQFAEYVRNIRFAEQCLGESISTAVPEQCEAEMLRYKVGT